MKLNLKLFFVAAFALLLFTHSARAQTKAERIDALVEKYGEYGKFNGSYLVAQDGKVLTKGGIGLANMEWQMPNTADTKHRLGSITKQFTAMLILQLVQEGKVALDAPIATYLPDYPKKTGDIITVHHLLTHTGGVPNYTTPLFFAEQSRDDYTPDDFVKVFAEKELDFAPGEKFNYSNSGYFLLGVIIEKVTSMTYEEALQTMVLQPLGMKNSGYDNYEDILEKRATGYEKTGEGYKTADYLSMTLPYSAGSMYATVEDLFTWDRALATGKLLDEKMQKLYYAPHVEALGMHYAYGWLVGENTVGNTEETVSVIAHSGGINGFNTNLTRYPHDQSVIILLNNTGGAPLQKMTEQISGILEGKTYDMPRASIAAEVKKAMQNGTKADGLAVYEKLKNDAGYELDEDEMNAAGYVVLREGNTEGALAMFKINMQEFPKSSNVYDSYAEAQMKNGNEAEAIKNYRKSYAMNPANMNAVEMIKKMGGDTSDLEKEITVDAAILESYVGKYELAPSFILTVTKEGKQMKAQATGQPAFDIFPSSDTEFYLTAVEARLVFKVNEKGEAERVILLQGGQEIEGEKVE